MRFSHREVAWPYQNESILDIQPALNGNWAVLTKGAVFAIVDDSGVELSSQTLPLDGLNLDQLVMLRLSRDQRFAVIAEEYGPQGVVMDLPSGETLMLLTRGSYHVQHCSFPVAFFEHAGKTLLVHATDWNRLDISDPLTGACLSNRSTPERELDYFHSRLSVSPGQSRIFDNGWKWHPLGVPRTWSLEAWANGNVWESENGTSVRELHTGGHMWDAPMAWRDDQTVIVWGLGEELEGEQPLRPGVRIFDAVSGEEKAVIEEVQVEPHALFPRNPAKEGWIAFDTWLYAISPETGTAVWDLSAGTQLHHDPELKPRRYHPLSRTFISLAGGAARLSNLVED